MLLKRLISAVLCLSVVMLSLASCGEVWPKDPEPQAKVFYDLFNTKSIVYSYKGDSSAEFAANCKSVEQLLSKYHRLFDIYYEYSDTPNLKTVNDNAGKNAVKVDGKIIDLLEYAKEMYTLTGGEMNIAMGSVLSLWHESREAAQKSPDGASTPTRSALDEAMKHTSIENIVINREESTVYISDEKTRIDVGALGKGYATEMIGKMLKEKGISSYVLNIGGNIKTIGEKKNGEGWLTGITNPDKTSSESFACRVEIKNISCVTSGDYERYFTVGDKKYHHIIDKDTLMPSEHFASVSIITKDSGLADALSTALFTMSYEDGLALVTSLGGVEVLWITPEGEQHMTDGFKQLITEAN
jgi:thiamine biosynthesis lipoprotein